MDLHKLLKSYFSPLTIFGSIGFALVLLAVVLIAFWANRPGPRSYAPPTAILTVIPYPTVTLPVVQPTLPVENVPASPEPGTPVPGNITLGSYVQVSGTGGDGLRVRLDPGLGGEVLFIAIEAEDFQVEDGPREVDGYTWWYLVAPYDETQHGWAVNNYLTVVQNP